MYNLSNIKINEKKSFRFEVTNIYESKERPKEYILRSCLELSNHYNYLRVNDITLKNNLQDYSGQLQIAQLINLDLKLNTIEITENGNFYYFRMLNVQDDSWNKEIILTQNELDQYINQGGENEQ
jgi:hypothetical protein